METFIPTLNFVQELQVTQNTLVLRLIHPHAPPGRAAGDSGLGSLCRAAGHTVSELGVLGQQRSHYRFQGGDCSRKHLFLSQPGSSLTSASAGSGPKLPAFCLARPLRTHRLSDLASFSHPLLPPGTQMCISLKHFRADSQRHRTLLCVRHGGLLKIPRAHAFSGPNFVLTKSSSYFDQSALKLGNIKCVAGNDELVLF